MAEGVLLDDHLYGFDEGVLKCLALAGKVVWNNRGLGKGALMAADGKLIKRPILQAGSVVLVGFSEDAYASSL